MDEKTEFQHESYPDDLPKQIEQSGDTYDAHDPLNWSGLRKLSVLIVTAIWTFLGTSNMIVAGPTLFPISEDLSVPIALTSYSIGGPLLAYGVASIIWVAFGNRFGVRLTFVGTATIAGCLCLWGAKATSFGELVAARTLSSLFFASPETLGPQMVGDVFLLKDRAKAVSLLVIMQGSGFACGPLFGAFIVEFVYHIFLQLNL
jgi:MFS family permease